jgi:hypothetical protein
VSSFVSRDYRERQGGRRVPGDARFDSPAPVAVSVEPLSPTPVAVNVEPLSPTEEPDVLSPTGLAVLRVSNDWLPDRGPDVDCGRNEVELRPVVPPVSDGPVCVPVRDPPPEALLDALPIVPVDPVRGGDKLDEVKAVFTEPLRPALGMEDGPLRLGVAVEP